MHEKLRHKSNMYKHKVRNIVHNNMQICINIIIVAVVYCILGISVLLIYNITKFFHIAHAITITASAYLVYLFSVQISISLWVSIPLAITFSTLIGMLSELCIYRPLRKRGASPMALLIASIGLYTLLQNFISMICGDNTKSIRVGEVNVGYPFLGAYVTDIQIITIVTCLIMLVICTIFLRYNKIGRNIRAVSNNPELSNIFGINSGGIILWVFAISSTLAALIGVLVAFDSDIFPTMGFNLLLYGVVAMIIGGVNGIWGVVGGSLLLAAAQHMAAYYIGNQWMDAMAYIVLIIFLLWKPFGFSGIRLKKKEI